MVPWYEKPLIFAKRKYNDDVHTPFVRQDHTGCVKMTKKKKRREIFGRARLIGRKNYRKNLEGPLDVSSL